MPPGVGYGRPGRQGRFGGGLGLGRQTIPGREKLDTRTFGGNTGQQGVFDAKDPSAQQQAVSRLSALTQQYGPMLSGTFTGDTGFAPGDAESFYALQNAVVEARNIQNSLAGQSPVNIRSGGRTGSQFEDARMEAAGAHQLRAREGAEQRGVSPSLQSLEDLIMGRGLRRV